MLDSEAIKGAIAGGFVVATAVLALRSGTRAHVTRDRRPVPAEISGAAPPAAAEQTLPLAPGITRPRIFTGEPGIAEPRPAGPLRALKLIGGMAMLAFVGAIGLLALVRAIVAMFTG